MQSYDELPEVAARAQQFARGANLGAVAAVLRQHRREILTEWLAVVCRQPVHERRAGRGVVDHMAGVFDALTGVLERAAPSWLDGGLPLDDPAVSDAAQRYARSRFEQGLKTADLVTEFRLLRQEIGRALQTYVPNQAPTGDVIAAELLLHDALDGATTLALTALGQELEQLREDVLAMTIHDVQQPLVSLKGRVQFATRLLSRPTAELDQVVAMLQQANVEIDRLSALLAGVGQASRVAVGRLEIQPVPADMRELLRTALDRLDPDTHARCRLELEHAAATTGTWDIQLIERVLANLVSNAAKYSDAASPIEIHVTNLDGAVHVMVGDRGMGLAADELAQLFQRYTRSQRARDRGAMGAGLGLYVCAGIVQAHGGRIWAESDGVGHGAKFHVLLPAAHT